LSIDNVKAMKPLYTGLRKVIGVPTFLSTKLPLPPRTEQDQIVRFLDWQLSKINKLINAKKRQIELLKEQKQAIINKAVTKGLYENVPMKDSGVEWIGEIPSSYTRCKLKHIGVFQSGKNLTSLDIEEDSTYRVYGGNGFRGYYESYLFDGEHLLIGRQGALCGNIHYVNERFWATEHAITVKTNYRIIAKWAYYLIKVMNLNQYSQAAAQPGLAVEKIINIGAFFPSIGEQQDIVEYLDEKCSQIDILITKVNEEINLLHEYRTRLISDVVTGKVNVRDIVVPDFEAVEEVSEDTEEINEVLEVDN